MTGEDRFMKKQCFLKAIALLAAAALLFMMVGCARGGSEKSLEALLKTQTSDPILSFDYDDYDGDGTYEAFVFVGKEISAEPGSPYYEGDLWFVNADGAQKLEEGLYVYTKYDLQTFGKYKFIIYTLPAATSYPSVVWGVRDGKPREEIISGRYEYERTDDVNFIMIQSALDDGYNDGLLLGRTWKPYYFFWDEKTESFKEYGGIEITQAQLLRCDGAKEIIDAIKAKRYSISEIFYRGNNIININYNDVTIVDGEKNGGNANATLKLQGNSVELMPGMGFGDTDLEKSNNAGIYKAALIPEAAVYPDEFPVS